MNPIEKISFDHQSARDLGDSNADICFLALSNEGSPSVRTLVMRGITEDGLTLFINKTSPKWRTLQINNQAEVLLWYPTIQRQYRVSGQIDELPRDSITSNWPRRPAGSKYLDYAYQNFSAQSRQIQSRQALVAHIDSFKADNHEDTLTTPEIATGIILRPAAVECLDLNSHDRIHDRRYYSLVDDNWQEVQLMP